MKTNKITLIVMGLALASLVASCKKNDNAAAVGEGFRAFTEQGDNGNSRTHGVADGSTIQVQWTSGDQILVANQGGSGSTLTYNLKGGANSTEGSFASDNETDDFLQPDYVAIYPATNAAGVANSISGTTATFNLPATQAYLEGSFAEKAMPMVAYSTEQSLQFKNVLGGLCFPVVGNTKVTKVEVISADANEALWGACTTTVSSDPTSTVSNTEANKNVITLDCGSGIVLDGTTATDFYVMVPAGTLASGFTVKAYNGNSVIYQKSTTNAPGANFIPRGTVRKVNNNLSIDFAVTTISPTYITNTSAKGIGKTSHVFTVNGILYAKASNYSGMTNEQIKQALVVGGSSVYQATATPAIQYDVDLTGLEENTVYYVRAYAKTYDNVIIYGDEVIPFATRKNYFGDTYKGKLPGEFTVNANGKKVQFSAGNLQYQASTNTWRFADYQFDFVGGIQYGVSYGTVYENNTKCDNGQISQTYSGWIDLFGWGTSGYPHRESCYQPWSASDETSKYLAYGTPYLNLNSSDGRADWGYNAISNGGNDENIWRSLYGFNNGVANNTAEWTYIFNRNCSYRFAHARLVVKGSSSDVIEEGSNCCGTSVYGMLLFPDVFTWPQLVPSITVNQDAAFDSNQLTEAQWSLLEKEGAVFLPAAGARRQNADIYHLNTQGYPRGIYWTASFVVRNGEPESGNSFCLYFWTGDKKIEDPENPIWRGRSVRLVRDVN